MSGAVATMIPLGWRDQAGSDFVSLATHESLAEFVSGAPRLFPTDASLSGMKRPNSKLAGGYGIPSRGRSGSCRCDSTLRMCGSSGSEYSRCGSGDEVALKVEGLVDGGMYVEEALG